MAKVGNVNTTSILYAIRLGCHTIGNVVIADPPLGIPISIAFPLPLRNIALEHRTREIRARLRGDEVFATDHFGADLTFFDPYDE